MDNHPNINIISSPDNNCPSAVWNCIQYCFESLDHETASGEKATMIVQFSATNELDGLDVSIGGHLFSTATPSGHDTFSWTGTAFDIAQDFARMLKANYEFGRKFFVSANNNNVIIIARNDGFEDNWTALFDVAVPPNVMLYVGQDSEYRENYRIVIEVWTVLNGNLINRMASLAYSPDTEASTMCIDISQIVNNQVATMFPSLTPSSEVFVDETISAEIALRYGQVYSDDEAACGTSAKYFEETTPITIYNAAFQRDEIETVAPFCFTEALFEQRFLTKNQATVTLCSNSYAWLWFDLHSFYFEVLSGATVTPVYVFEYSDGTSEQVLGDEISDSGYVVIPSGHIQLSSLYDNSKTVTSYTVAMGVSSATTSVFVISEVKRYDIDVSCCDVQEFYFLSEAGGYDTILFAGITDVDFVYESSSVDSYVSCGGDLLQGGRMEAEAKAMDVISVSSRFVADYGVRWLREFLKSPVRLWRNGEKLYRVLLLTDKVVMYRKDDYVYITMEFVTNFEYNQQKN